MFTNLSRYDGIITQKVMNLIFSSFNPDFSNRFDSYKTYVDKFYPYIESYRKFTSKYDIQYNNMCINLAENIILCQRACENFLDPISSTEQTRMHNFISKDYQSFYEELDYDSANFDFTELISGLLEKQKTVVHTIQHVCTNLPMDLIGYIEKQLLFEYELIDNKITEAENLESDIARKNIAKTLHLRLQKYNMDRLELELQKTRC
jgi:hypothetical protein